jgi:energy-coupling factor transporter ATP-binding protein EcfA2
VSTTIAVRNLSVRYRGAERRALDEVDFEAAEGEILGVLGPTGAGKSTLLKCLAGVIPHFEHDARYKGSLSVLGRELAESDSLASVAADVGLVLQDPEVQLVNTTVREELAWGMENRGVPVPVILDRVDRAAELFGLTDLLDRFTHALSGGEKQRTVVAATFCLDPRVMLLDEPTSELDPAGTDDVMRAIRTVAAQGVTVVIVEHKVEELAEYADRLVQLDHGAVTAVGTPRELLTSPRAVHRPPVLALARRLRELRAWPSTELPLTVDEAVAQWTGGAGRVVPHAPAAPSAVPRPDVLTLRDVRHVYPGGVAALTGVELAIGRGEFVAIIGKNGSGKTTLAKHLNGMLHPTNRNGTVTVTPAGAPPFRTGERRLHQIARHVGYVFQNPDRQIFHDSCAEELEFGLRNLGVPEAEIGPRVGETLRAVGLAGRERTNPAHMSRGERQRLAIAATLVMEPEVAVIDEPTTGQDPAEARLILDVLAAYCRAGHTVVIISHDMALVAGYADRIVAMRHGSVLADGPPREVFAMVDVLDTTNIRPPQLTAFGSRIGAPVLLDHDEAVAALSGLAANERC